MAQLQDNRSRGGEGAERVHGVHAGQSGVCGSSCCVLVTRLLLLLCQKPLQEQLPIVL
jgi:hypothetical protein